MSTVSDRVNDGVKFVEANYGTDWRSGIDLNTFDISDGFSCVLGQLHGEYLSALDVFELSDEYASEMGFNVDSNDGTPFNVQIRDLQKEWVKVIRIDNAIRNAWLMSERELHLSDLPHTD